MNASNCTIRSVRNVCNRLPRQRCLYASTRPLTTTTKPHTSNDASPSETPRNPLDPVAIHRLQAARRAYYKRRSYYAGAGFIGGMIAIALLASQVDLPGNTPPAKLDARSNDPLVKLGKESRVVIQKLGEEGEEPDTAPTGTTTVPTFPRTLEFLDSQDEAAAASSMTENGKVEYQLLGLGVRTVSFLSIEVYVVGLYVATDDIAALQEALIRRIDPVATTLVAGEKEKLRNLLLDPAAGEKAWSEILRDTHIRTVVRVVPCKDADFPHLRDAWVRAITTRAQKEPAEYGDKEFGTHINEFKAIFTKGLVPKKKEMLLARNEKGELAVWYEDGKQPSRRLGGLADERISRAVWLNYLGGSKVASEKMRETVVDGVMEFVERPIGTVATQVKL